MANAKNLIPNEARTPEKRRENASKAGKASVMARRRKKTLRETFEAIFALPAPEKERERFKELFPGLSENEMDMQFALCMNVFESTKNKQYAGANYEKIRDTMGDAGSDVSAVVVINRARHDNKGGLTS